MNKHGLYSKAAQIIRSLPQERGTAEQMVAAAKNMKLGLKELELQNAGPLPTGKVTREQLAKHFEDNLPGIGITQYGENPRYTTNEEDKRRSELLARDQLSPEEEVEYNRLSQRHKSRPEAETSSYSEDLLKEKKYWTCDHIVCINNSPNGTIEEFLNNNQVLHICDPAEPAK